MKIIEIRFPPSDWGEEETWGYFCPKGTTLEEYLQMETVEVDYSKVNFKSLHRKYEEAGWREGQKIIYLFDPDASYYLNLPNKGR